jgi:hypothetical protein
MAAHARRQRHLIGAIAEGRQQPGGRRLGVQLGIAPVLDLQHLAAREDTVELGSGPGRLFGDEPTGIESRPGGVREPVAKSRLPQQGSAPALAVGAVEPQQRRGARSGDGDGGGARFG